MVWSPVRSLVVAAAFAIALGGCAQYYWSRPGASPEQFDRDSRDCAHASAENPTAAALGLVNEPLYRACLAGRGWAREKQWEPPPAGWYRGIE